MELNHLRYFYEVAQTGAFTLAAKNLRISQSAVSKIIAKLEADLGADLFLRGRTGIRLTGEGVRLREHCQAIFQEVQKIQKRKSGAQIGDWPAELRIGVSENLANYIVPTVIREMRNRSGNLRFKIMAGTSESLLSRLLSHELDFALFYSIRANIRVNTLTLCEVPFSIVLSPQISFSRFAALRSVPYVGSLRSDYPSGIPVVSLLKSTGLSPTAAIECNHLETQKRLALQGVGYTVLPSFMVKDEVGQGSLRAVKPPKAIALPLFLVTRKESITSPCTEIFLAALVRRIRDEGP